MQSKYLACVVLAGSAHAATLQQQFARQEGFTITEEFNGLAQTEQTSGNYCHSVHERVKNAQNIFYGVQAGTSEYVDSTFPRDSMIRNDVHPSYNPTGDSLKDKETNAMWVDSIDILYEEPEYSLFGSNGIGADDIFQGSIGDCWFMHGASAVAQKPGRLERIFLNDSLSSNGIYGFQFYVLGVPMTITIDDSLPLDSNGKAVFAGVSKDGALWGPLIEKAFAKLHGTYESLIAGSAKHSIEVLSGAPASWYSHGSKNASEIFEMVRAAFRVDGMVSASTPASAGGDSDKSANGLAQNHLYTVFGAFEVQNQNGQTVQLYKIRNPWGSEGYKGPYSDSDTANWDTSLQNAVGYYNKDDGFFFIDAQTYHAEYGATSVHVDTTNMKQSYFLVKDDVSTRNADGPFCGFNNCQSKKHKFTVKSLENQMVYMSTQTWPVRTYPSDCVKSGTTLIGPAAAQHYTHFADKQLQTRYPNDWTWNYWSESLNLEGFQIAAGQELTVTMEMDWKDNATKDLSLVFWGTGSQPLLITSDYEETNQSTFPFTNPQANDGNAAQESGADLCAVNPAEVAFKTWYTNLSAYTGSCGSMMRWNTMGNGDFFYAQLGGCNSDSLYTSFSQTQSFWDDVWISEGAVLMETTGPSNGLITKKFNLKTGTNADRVAFFVKAKNNVTAEQMNPSSDWCNNCNAWSNYTVIGASGNAASCDGSSTTTDGSDEADTNTDGNTDDTTDITDGGDTTPTPAADSAAIQQLLDTYATALSIPNSTCGYTEAVPSVQNGFRFNGIRIACSTYPNRAVMISYTDTAANWAQVVDHCKNVLMGQTTNGNQVTRTYAAWGPAGVNTVAFYRPSALTASTGHGLALYSDNGFTMPTNPVCANSAPITDTTDNTTNNNAATAAAVLAEGYKAQAQTLESEASAALQDAINRRASIEGKKVTAGAQKKIAEDARGVCQTKLSAAQGLTVQSQLETLQTDATTSRDTAVAAANAAGTAHVSAASIKTGELVNAVALATTKKTALKAVKDSCAQALTDANQYTATDEQQAAKQRTIAACAAVDSAYTTAADGLITEGTWTTYVASTVQEIQRLSVLAEGFAQEANGFVSAIGDLVTANDSSAIAANDQAALDLATQAESFKDQSAQHAGASSAALTTANQHKSTIDGYASTATARHSDALTAHGLVQTALQEAQQLGVDVSALQAKKAVADTQIGALNTAKAAANTAYTNALSLHNGDFTTAINLVETKRQATEVAMNNAATALASAAQYQANDAQKAAYARSQAASQAATVKYNEAASTKLQADTLLQASTASIRTANEKKASAVQLSTQAAGYITSIDELIAVAQAAAGNGGDTATCQDTDGTAVDIYNEGCWSYTAGPQYCGTDYDDADFTANSMCCACGGGSTAGSADSATDTTTDTTTDSTTCVNDETTPQACLDKWVVDFQFTPQACFINSQTLTMTMNGSPTHAYILFYGGCGDKLVDVWFQKTAAQWNNLLIWSGANATPDVGNQKHFNLQTGGVAKVGFRVPVNQLTGFEYSGVAVL